MVRSNREFGAEMYRHRTAKGLSLTMLAKRTFYSKGHLSKVENGHKRPSEDLTRALDLSLEANGTLIALVEEINTTPAVDGDAGWWVMGVGPDRGALLDSTSQRGILSAETLSILRPASSQSAPKRINRELRQQWTGWLSNIRKLGQCASPQVVLPIVIGQLHSLLILANSACGSDRAELYRAASRHAEYAGWMFQEAGADPEALVLTGRAVELATAGKDLTMARYALIRRALIALYAGDHVATVALAGQATADHAMSPRLRGLAALRQAQGHALGGRRDDFERAMDHAEWLLERQLQDAGVTAQGPDAVPLGGSTFPNPTSITRGWALYDLGRYQDSASILEHEIRRIPGDARRAYARYTTRCALAHAASRNLEHACELTRTLLPWVDGLDSATIQRDLRRLEQRLRRWPSHQLVQQVLPDLKAALT